jgi:hypothetical protein
VTAVAWDSTERTLLVGTRTGGVSTHHLAAVPCTAHRTATLFDAAVTLLRWHSSGGVLLAAAHDGRLRVCTLALHPLDVGDHEASPMSLNFTQPSSSNAATATARPALAQWDQPAPHGCYGAVAPLHCSCVVAMEGGRGVALLRIDAGLAARGGLTARALTAQLLAENSPRMAVEVAAAAGDAHDRYRALSLAFHSLMRLEEPALDPVVHELMGSIAAAATTAPPDVAARLGELSRMLVQRLLRSPHGGEAAWARADASAHAASLEDVWVHAVRGGSRCSPKFRNSAQLSTYLPN